MGQGKQIWLAEISEAEEEFQEGRINEDEFRARLERLGLPPYKIDDAVTELNG